MEYIVTINDAERIDPVEDLDFLMKDEVEAINGYDQKIAHMKNDPSLKHLIEQLEHIKEEEIKHKAFLELAKTDLNATYKH